MIEPTAASKPSASSCMVRWRSAAAAASAICWRSASSAALRATRARISSTARPTAPTSSRRSRPRITASLSPRAIRRRASTSWPIGRVIPNTATRPAASRPARRPRPPRSRVLSRVRSVIAREVAGAVVDEGPDVPAEGAALRHHRVEGRIDGLVQQGEGLRLEAAARQGARLRAVGHEAVDLLLQRVDARPEAGRRVAQFRQHLVQALAGLLESLVGLLHLVGARLGDVAEVEVAHREDQPVDRPQVGDRLGVVVRRSGCRRCRSSTSAWWRTRGSR